MAISDRFLAQAAVGKKVDLVSGPKEIVGEIVSVDAEVVGIKKEDGKVAVIDVQTISYYEIFEEENKEEPQEEIAVDYSVFNEFEQAAIQCDIEKMSSLVSDTEKMLQMGYNDKQAEDLVKRVKNFALPKGDDFYSTAGRLAGLQGNANSTAQFFYEKALESGICTDTQRIKAIRILQVYYSKEKKNDKFLALFDEHFEELDFSTCDSLRTAATIFDEEGRDGLELFKKVVLPLNNEADFIHVFHYLQNKPDGDIFDKAVKELLKRNEYPHAAEQALVCAANIYLDEEFENLRTDLFILMVNTATPAALSRILAVKHEVCETVSLSREEENEEGEETVRRDFNDILAEYRQDEKFFIVRAWAYLNINQIPEASIEEDVNTFRENVGKDLQAALKEEDQRKAKYIMAVSKVLGIEINEVIAEISVEKDEENSDLLKAIISYNPDRIKEILEDEVILLNLGYSLKDKERFEKYLQNCAYPVGNSDYEIASRLNAWGFNRYAVKFYMNVVADTYNEKRKNALNQLVAYAVQNKNIELFEQYYPELDEKQKRNELYLRLLNECKYVHGEYKELYNIYLLNKNSSDDPVIRGALRYKNNKDNRAELIDKACQASHLDYDFWKEYLSDLYDESPDEYREVFFKLLDDYTIKVTFNLESCFEMIALDNRFSTEITKELVLDAIKERYPLAMIMILCVKSDDDGEELRAEVLKSAVERLYEGIEEMEYRTVHSVASFITRFFVDSQDIKNILRISENGIDMYNMLPSGKDNYAKGKRILKLGEDYDRAFKCFKEEIEQSTDRKTIALCGVELLEGLCESERYEEVIHWGHVLLIDKGIVGYSTLALDVEKAFGALGDASAKAEFVGELASRIRSDISEGNLSEAIGRITIVEIIDKDNEVVAEFGELMDKFRDEKMNFDENTFIGRANVIHIVEHDEAKYMDFLKNGIRQGKVDEEEKDSVVALFLEAAISNGKLLENSDFIDELSTIGIALSEHTADLLLYAVSSNRNIGKAIDYFTDLYENAGDNGKSLVLTELEKLYLDALDARAEFDTEIAMKHMLELSKQSPSVKSRLCYVWLMAYSGNANAAKEILALIPEDMCDEENNNIAKIITENFFDGDYPVLSEIFNELVKEKTLLSFIEYSKVYKDFIVYSQEENVIHTELIKDTANRVDISSEVVRNAIIKTLYESPTRYKLWQLFSLSVKDLGDLALAYCANINLSIVNHNMTDDAAGKRAQGILSHSPEISARYGHYWLYNKVCHLYILNILSKDEKIKKKLFDFASKKSSLEGCTERTKVAEDYIHLLKTLDDRNDYIYIKSAMFLATNNRCEQYFYDLFKNDLLRREQIICLKMCIEMINKNKFGNDADVFLSDLLEANHDLEGVISVLLNRSEYIGYIVSLLKDYPALPQEKHLNDTLAKVAKDFQKQIDILEELDRCYSDAVLIKEKLLVLYRYHDTKIDFEKVYQTTLFLLKHDTDEEELFRHCRLAGILATALGKTNRIADIRSIYESQSLEKRYGDTLENVFNACENIEGINDEELNRLFYTIVTGRYDSLFSDEMTYILLKTKGIETIINYERDKYLRSAFSYINYLFEKGDERLNEGIDELTRCNEIIFGDDLQRFIDAFMASSIEKRKLFIFIMNINRFADATVVIPNDEDFVKLLVETWDKEYEQDYIISCIKCKRPATVGISLVYLCAISLYANRELLKIYVDRLFETKQYALVVAVKDRIDWAIRDVYYSAYLAVSLLYTSSPIAIEYITRMRGEFFVNVILLLKKSRNEEEIYRIYTQDPSKKEIVECIEAIINSPDAEQIEVIEKLDNEENRNALMKLLFHMTEEEEVADAIHSKYGEEIRHNEYISRWKRTNRLNTGRMYFEAGTAENKKEPVSLKITDCDYLKEAMEEFSAEEYKANIPYGARDNLTNSYHDLGANMRVNAQFRRELLIKLAMVSLSQNDNLAYLEYIEKLGVATYHCNIENKPEKARNALLETVLLLDERTKHSNVVEMVRKTVCEMLAGYSGINEILSDRKKLQDIFKHILTVSIAWEYSEFFTKMEGYITQLVEADEETEVAKKIRKYQAVSNELNHGVGRTQNTLFINAYHQWNKIVVEENRKLASGTIVKLELENTQCHARGKICFILENIGKIKAENIKIIGIFGDNVRCRDNEKEIKVLYGGDINAFAFNIRVKEKGICNFRVELSYNTKDQDGNDTRRSAVYDETVCIVDEKEYEHIGNLYSIQPVSTNAEFYGREKEKEHILAFLNDVTYNTSMVIHGLKRVGKTSMLRFVERSFYDSEYYIPVYKSAQGAGEKTPVCDMFVRPIVNELQARGIADEKCKSYLEYDYSEEPNILYDFYLYLQKSEIMGKKRILFLADEIEEIFDLEHDGKISKKIYKVLRVILQEISSVRFIFCGADQLTDILFKHEVADIFEITKPVTLKRLDEDSTRKMIVEPAAGKITYTPRALERLWYYTKGHTFYSKHICNKVIDILNEESRATAYAYDIDDALKMVMVITEYFKYLSRFTSETDKQVINLMCSNIKFAREMVSEDTLVSQFEGIGLKDSLTALEFKDVIEKYEGLECDMYQFSIEMFRLWYMKADYFTEMRKDQE